MSFAEIAWSLGLLGLLFLGFGVFKRVRLRAYDYRQTQLFKARLPRWVAQFEALALCALVAGSLPTFVWLLSRLDQGHLAPLVKTAGPSVMFVVCGAMLICVPLCALCVNLMSWLLPPIRKTNLAAMSGLQVSYWTMNRGLLVFGAISVPLGITLIGLAVLAPWA